MAIPRRFFTGIYSKTLSKIVPAKLRGIIIKSALEKRGQLFSPHLPVCTAGISTLLKTGYRFFRRLPGITGPVPPPLLIRIYSLLLVCLLYLSPTQLSMPQNQESVKKQQKPRRNKVHFRKLAPDWKNSRKSTLKRRGLKSCVIRYDYWLMPVTTPEPTVRPPSRIAKRRPSSIAMGVISSTSITTLSPGMHISVPSGRVITPVTSVVRK